MAKYRSSQNWKTQDDGFKRGWISGVEDALYIKEESTRGTFVAPNIGTQGSSTSAATPSTDISGGTDTTLRVAVDGASVVTATIASLVSLDTGAEIAAALETAINSALSTAGQEGRVWVDYTGGLYKVWSQKVGTGSSVVITNGLSNNVADDLKLGTGNGGTEAAGTNGTDYCLKTKADFKLTQPFEKSKHKTGRQANNVIKKKKMLEGEIETYLCVGTGGSPSIDAAVSTLLESVFGRKTTVGSTEIKFDAVQAPSKYFSALHVSNVHNMAMTGLYTKSLTISQAGDGEAMMKFSVKGADAKSTSVAKINGAISASATFATDTNDAENLEVGARVMIVDEDGQTVVAGADGSLTIATLPTASGGTFSAAVTAADNSYIVPYAPQYFGAGAVEGTDNPLTSLQGAVSFDGGSTTVAEIHNVEFSFDPAGEDLDNIYGQSTNYGRVSGGRANIRLKVSLRLSASQYSKYLKTKGDNFFSMIVYFGDTTGRHVKLACPRVRYDVPAVSMPDENSVQLDFDGECLATDVGQLDAVTLSFL